MNAADTAWILTATALVLLMTLPGLALFYGGLVRARNILSVFMHNAAIAALMSILWMALGYSIAFGDGGAANAIWGGTGKAFLVGIGPEDLWGTIPEILFFAFQMTFAIITPALIVGAYVERIRFAFVLAFSALWMLVVYAPVVHWVWAPGGWALGMGAVDLAGGIVVHQTAGLSALIVAWFLGPRRNRHVPPHSPGFVFVGAGLLWVGWYGFNAGSQLGANGAAGMTLVVTHISAATASLSWILWERIRYGRASLIGLVTGAIAGLASITPASGSVGPLEALAIGAVAGVLCQEAVTFVRARSGIDDTLDVFAVHGVGGIFGTLMIAVFGHAAFSVQLAALAGVGLWTVLATVLIIVVLRLFVPLRVDAEAESNGLDLSAHGERAYEFNA